MKEKPVLHPPATSPLEVIKDSLFLPPFSSRKQVLSKREPFPDLGVTLEDKELKDVSSLLEDDSLVEIVAASEVSKPFAGFVSYRQRCGNAQDNVRPSRGRNGRSCEAPAKLGSGARSQRNLSPERVEGNIPGTTLYSSHTLARTVSPSCPLNINKEQPPLMDAKVQGRLQKQRSFSTDLDRDEAWERKKELFAVDELGSTQKLKARPVGRSLSDCGDRSCSDRPITRTRSLTDEDLEELRGCIDLGFGFSYDESCDLRSTLPALDLYYAINRQYVDLTSRSSPASPCDGAPLERTSSGGSPRSPLNDAWRVSSPGDHPSQVKTRLRHWAQAVACSLKQGL